MTNSASMITTFSAIEPTFLEIDQWFQSLDNLIQLIDGSGSIIYQDGYVMLDSGMVADGAATLGQWAQFQVNAFTWDTGRRFKCLAQIDHKEDAACDQFIMSGYHQPYLTGFGFRFLDGKIQGFAASLGSETDVDLELFVNPAYLETREFYAEFTPGVGVNFFLDGVLRGSVSTNLPDVEDYAIYPWTIKAKTGIDDSQIIRTGRIIVSQDV